MDRDAISLKHRRRDDKVVDEHSALLVSKGRHACQQQCVCEKYNARQWASANPVEAASRKSLRQLHQAVTLPELKTPR